MHKDKKNVLLIAMPFAGVAIPSIQLSILEGYLQEREINIETKNLYLKAAEFYGLNNYNLLITSPNESYTAQMAFSKYVFPNHWEKNESRFREYYKKISSIDDEFQKNFTFEDYVEKTDLFYNWVVENIRWEDYDIIGFTLNYGQFLPSLAISKKIKEKHSEKKIIFGGSRTVKDLGKRVLESFDYVDFIVSGDGEKPLYLLASDYYNYQSIPLLMYKEKNKVFWNKSDEVSDINNLPLPSYDSFYKDLSLTSPEIQQFFCYYGRLPVEISRGCWWNKCSFCNYSIYLPKYREKNIKRIVSEIEFLSDRYSMLSFQIIGNTLPKKDYRILFEEIKKLGKDLNFFAEARAGQLRRNDYKIMKEAGFINIQIGIESLSKSYLKKINKGVRLIDNIAALKFCKEYGIRNEYNFIVRYPNEEEIDFEETKKNVKLIKQYLDPPRINDLLVGFESCIYNNPNIFNIEKLDYSDIDKLMFPDEFLKKNICFFYNFKRRIDFGKNNWENIVEEWINKKEKNEINAMKSRELIDRLIFYFIDGKNFIKIFDKRNSDHVGIYVLDETERMVFLSCLDVISYQELQDKFKDMPDYQLAATLHSFEKIGLVFKEDEWYLSLPLDYSKVIGLEREVSNSLTEDIEKELTV